MAICHTTAVQRCIENLQANHPGARDELIRISRDRLLAMVRNLLTRYPGLRRWEQSEDVLHNVYPRLLRCLDQVPLGSARDFLCLAAFNMRNELLDLTRHYFGVNGPGKNHATPHAGDEGRGEMENAAGSGRDDPALLAEFAELHEHVGRLPDDERAVVDLHWYHGLTHREAAKILGTSPETVKRRWLAAKVMLATRLGRPVLA